MKNRPKNPKKIEQYITESILIEKLIPGGEALGTLPDGKKVMLWNALPGETVAEFRVTQSKSSYLQGIATKIEHPSNFRIEPRDACYLSTSPWQMMTYEYELTQKVALLTENFRQQGITLPTDLTVQTDGKAYAYRNKMEYALYYDHDMAQISPAFHQRGSHRKVPITSSSLELLAIWQRVQEIVAELNAEHVDARSIQSILLRASQDGQVAGGSFINHQPRPVFPKLHDTILGHEYAYSPNGFFQINLPVYEMALREMMPFVTSKRVLDLYAGVGTIGLSVARDRKLTLVECDKSAYRELENNTVAAGLDRAAAVLAKSEESLEYIAPDQTVIVDPPRAGCDSKLLEKFLQVLPETIIYLSCNPATQARDVKILSAAYEITHVQPFNFFPRTPHLENLVVLTRRA